MYFPHIFNISEIKVHLQVNGILQSPLQYEVVAVSQLWTWSHYTHQCLQLSKRRMPLTPKVLNFQPFQNKSKRIIKSQSPAPEEASRCKRVIRDGKTDHHFIFPLSFTKLLPIMLSLNALFSTNVAHVYGCLKSFLNARSV